jgi:protein SCO1
VPVTLGAKEEEFVENMRRKLFAGLSGVAALSVLAGEWFAASAATGRRAAASGADREFSDSAPLVPFPNVTLRTQNDRPVRFYDDLLKGKVVLINFFFAGCTNFCPRTTANLAKLQDLFGDHFGREVVMLSITVDPAADTPAVLKKYAAPFRPKQGWYFLTGKKRDIDQIRRKLGVYDSDAEKTNHTGVLIYGNETLGTWTATHAMVRPELIAKSVSRLIVSK